VFRQLQVMRDFLVNDAWAGARVHQEIQLVDIADCPFRNNQVSPVQAPSATQASSDHLDRQLSNTRMRPPHSGFVQVG